jgi:hypothetical protein
MRNAVCLLLAVSAAGLIGVEVFARVFLGLGDPPLYQTHPRVEYLLKPGQDKLRFHNRVHINSYGMRSDELGAKKHDTIRILTLGDSVVYGGVLLDQSEIATQRLSQLLEATLKRRVEVGNASAKSWGPANQLAYLEEFGFFDADLVLVVISSHDLHDVPSFKGLDWRYHPWRKPVLASLEGATVYLPRYLPKLDLFQNTNDSKGIEASSVNPKAGPQALEQLVSHLAQCGLPVGFLFHPTRAELRGDDDDSSQAIQSILEAQGLELFRYDDLIKASDNDAAAYTDSIHLSATGQMALAKGLARMSTQLIEIDPAP